MTTATAAEAKTFTVTIIKELKESDLLETLTTAYEQGISYWATKATGTKRDEDLNVTITCLHWEPHSEGDPGRQTVDVHTVHRGVERILRREEGCRVRDDLYAQVLTLTTDDPDVDADAADCVLQAGMWGEIIYG